MGNNNQLKESILTKQNIDNPEKETSRIELNSNAQRDTINPTSTYPCRVDGLEWHGLSSEALLYLPEHEKGFTLNNTAKEIWDLCDGKNTIAEISRKLSYRFDCSEEKLLADVTTAIAQLHRESLLELKVDSPAKPN